MRNSQLSLLISTMFLIANVITDDGFMLFFAILWLVLYLVESLAERNG